MPRAGRHIAPPSSITPDPDLLPSSPTAGRANQRHHLDCILATALAHHRARRGAALREHLRRRERDKEGSGDVP